MCKAVIALRAATNKVRLTYNSDDVVEVLKTTELINGKVIQEAIEYGYYDSEADAFRQLAMESDYTVDALKKAHQAHKARVIIHTELVNNAKIENRREHVPAKNSVSLKVQEEKLASLSDRAVRELAVGTVDSHKNVQPKAVELAVAVLKDLPSQPTAKVVKSARVQHTANDRANTAKVLKLRHKHPQLSHWDDELLLYSASATHGVVVEEVIALGDNGYVPDKSEFRDALVVCHKRKQDAHIEGLANGTIAGNTIEEQEAVRVKHIADLKEQSIIERPEDFEMNKTRSRAGMFSAVLRVATRTTRGQIDKQTKSHMLECLLAMGYTNTDIIQFRK